MNVVAWQKARNTGKGKHITRNKKRGEAVLYIVRNTRTDGKEIFNDCHIVQASLLEKLSRHTPRNEHPLLFLAELHRAILLLGRDILRPVAAR